MVVRIVANEPAGGAAEEFGPRFGGWLESPRDPSVLILCVTYGRWSTVRITQFVVECFETRSICNVDRRFNYDHRPRSREAK